MTKPKLNEEFVVELQGKSFVTYNGLVDLAHQIGLKSIETEIVQFPNKENGNQCIVKATVTTEDGQMFDGYGDADPSNVNRMIARHLIRMAETRAKARALRDLTNVGMTAVEELGGEDSDNDSRPNTQTSSSNGNKASDKQLGFVYNLVKSKDYGTDKMAEYIKDNFGKSNSKELTKSEASQIIEMLQEEE